MCDLEAETSYGDQTNQPNADYSHAKPIRSVNTAHLQTPEAESKLLGSAMFSQMRLPRGADLQMTSALPKPWYYEALSHSALRASVTRQWALDFLPLPSRHTTICKLPVLICREAPSKPLAHLTLQGLESGA